MNKELKGFVSIPNYVEYRELDGEGVILNLNNEQYYGLDSVAVRMWELLSSLFEMEKVFNALQIEYQVDPDVLKNDLIEFVSQLSNQGLIDIKYEND